jgi:hypothetical protein
MGGVGDSKSLKTIAIQAEIWTVSFRVVEHLNLGLLPVRVQTYIKVTFLEVWQHVPSTLSDDSSRPFDE